MLAGDRLEQVGDLVHEGLAPADDVPVGPPEAHERVARLGDEEALEALLVGDLELVQALHVEGDRAVLAVDLERIRVGPAAGQLRAFERPQHAVLELDRRDEVVVHPAARDDRPHAGGDVGDLADEVAGKVDRV